MLYFTPYTDFMIVNKLENVTDIAEAFAEAAKHRKTLIYSCSCSNSLGYVTLLVLVCVVNVTLTHSFLNNFGGVIANIGLTWWIFKCENSDLNFYSSVE